MTTSLGAMSRLGSMLAGGAAVFGLASTSCHSLRFVDQPPVWRVADTASIPEPKERDYLIIPYFADVFAMRRFERTLEIKGLPPAEDINSLEEVPDSTWFENRIGVRDMTPAELAMGPSKKGGPHPPYEVKSGKFGGGALGFVIKDVDGRSFLVKFDRAENPEMQTGNDVVVDRLFWGFGYHVPADYVLFVKRSEITIEKKAKAKNELGESVPFTEKMLEAAMVAGPKPKEGVFRATASEFLEGVPKGGFSAEGVRNDDPNDTIPHENRRELRGLRVLAAWLNHTDMKEDNTLDMYVTDGNRKYLRHCFVDFGEALGGHSAEKNRREDGYEYYFDWEKQTRALFTLGLEKRIWEDLTPTKYKSMGLFTAKYFEPENWREAYPYWPFMQMDPVDAFWGAKILMRFSNAHIEAVVKEGEFTEPGASQYLVDTLEARRDAIGRVFLDALSPLDKFEIADGRICATDLAMLYKVAGAGTLERLDDGDVVESTKIDKAGHACVKLPAGGDYQVVSLRVRRGPVVRPPVDLHIAGGRAPHLVGLERHKP